MVWQNNLYHDNVKHQLNINQYISYPMHTLHNTYINMLIYHIFTNLVFQYIAYTKCILSFNIWSLLSEYLHLTVGLLVFYPSTSFEVLSV
jgi:hypothetical protein